MTDRVYPNLETFFDETRTQQDVFAGELGISASYLSRIKNNLAEPPLELALKISRKANVPLESLIREVTQ